MSKLVPFPRLKYKRVAYQGAWSAKPVHWDDVAQCKVPGYHRTFRDVFVFSIVNFADNTDAEAFCKAWDGGIACRLHLMGAECECTQETSVYGQTHPAASTTNGVIRVAL